MQTCWASFNSGSFIVGEDNTENYCTLCGEGGDLVCCDTCIRSFCQACIRRTSGEPFLQSLLQEDSTWNCYCCDGRPLTKQQQLCKDLCDYYHIRKHCLNKQGGEINCDTSGNETDPLIVTSTAVKKQLRVEGKGTSTPGMESDEKRTKSKKFKTPALIDSDSSSDGKGSVEVHSDDVMVSDVETTLKKEKGKASRRAVVGASSESEHEVKVERKGIDDEDGDKAQKKKNKKKRHGRRWQLGSVCGSSSSDSSDEAHPPRPKKRSWSSSASESAAQSKKAKHSELAAAVSSDSDGDKERCGVKLGDPSNHEEIATLKGTDDSSDLVTAVTYAPFRALSTSGSDEETTDQRPKGGTAIAESSTDSEGATVVGGKQPPAVRGSDSDVMEKREPRGPPNKKKRVVRGLLSSDEDSTEEPKERPAKKEKDEEGEEEEGEDSQDKAAGKKRRRIREIIADSKLTVLTKEAQKQEKERIERLKARASKQEGKQAEQRLILEEDPKTKEVKVEVRRSLVPSLLPHQKEGVKFLYDSCIESLERLQSEGRTKGSGGDGCILAHCMGLGKTLQVRSGNFLWKRVIL